MSAGGFTNSFYSTDNGNICPILVQPETLELEVNGALNELAGVNQGTEDFPTATVSGSRRGRGRIFARTISMRLVNAADAPAGGYVGNGILRIPVVLRDLFDTISKGTRVTYLGKLYRVVGKTPEKIS